MWRLRRYWFLICVYSMALLAGLWEVFDIAWKEQGAPPQLSKAMLELYPASSEMQYALGLHAVVNGELERAREHFEQALSTGVKTDENLFYYYAVTLVHLQADEAEVEKAIAAWKYNFPKSARPDPRKAGAEAMPPAQSTY